MFVILLTDEARKETILHYFFCAKFFTATDQLIKNVVYFALNSSKFFFLSQERGEGAVYEITAVNSLPGSQSILKIITKSCSHSSRKKSSVASESNMQNHAGGLSAVVKK